MKLKEPVFPRHIVPQEDEKFGKPPSGWGGPPQPLISLKFDWLDGEVLQQVTGLAKLIYVQCEVHLEIVCKTYWPYFSVLGVFLAQVFCTEDMK